MSDATQTLKYLVVTKGRKIVYPTTSMDVVGAFTVDNLKKAMWEKYSHRDVEARRLNVYRPSVSLGDEEEDEDEDSDGQERIQNQVAEAFGNKQIVKLQSKELVQGITQTLIIEIPRFLPLPVWYILVDHENNALGRPERVSAESIADLGHCVKDQNASELQHVDASNLVVWRCEPKLFTKATTDEIKALNFKTAAVKLTVDDISDLGLDEEEMLIIQMPAPIQPINIPLRYKSVTALRKERLRPILAPSEFTPDRLLAYQTPDNDHRILCDRPSNLSPTIPVTLRHPILNEFSHNCETYEPKKEDYRFAQALSDLLGCLFDGVEYLKEFLQICSYNGIELERHLVPGTNYGTDGTIHVKNWPCLIVKLTPEDASTDPEPVFQTVAYYRAYLCEKELKDNFTFPCIGMFVVGPSIGFFGMAFTTHVNMQMLGLPLRLDCHSTNEKQWKVIARHLGALRVAVRKLEEMYAQDTFGIEVQIGTETAGDPVYFPAYCDFKTLEGRDAKVSYSLQPFEEKLLFYGTCSVDDGEEVEVCIKFVNKYSLEAHKWCTSEAEIFAPRVIGFTDLGGGWKMVVMERIDESFKMLTEMGRTKELYDSIKEKLTGLHQKGYVHGDVRDVNIMAKKENGGYSVRLLDFDWAGEIGETEYPWNVGISQVTRRPRGVYGGQLIKAEHDIKMLDYMFRDIVGSMSSWWILEPEE